MHELSNLHSCLMCLIEFLSFLTVRRQNHMKVSHNPQSFILAPLLIVARIIVVFFSKYFQSMDLLHTWIQFVKSVPTTQTGLICYFLSFLFSKFMILLLDAMWYPMNAIEVPFLGMWKHSRLSAGSKLCLWVSALFYYYFFFKFSI